MLKVMGKNVIVSPTDDTKVPLINPESLLSESVVTRINELEERINILEKYISERFHKMDKDHKLAARTRTSVGPTRGAEVATNAAAAAAAAAVAAASAAIFVDALLLLLLLVISHREAIQRLSQLIVTRGHNVMEIIQKLFTS